MSDIWSLDGSGGSLADKEEASEDWACSDSDDGARSAGKRRRAKPAAPRPKRARAAAAAGDAGDAACSDSNDNSGGAGDDLLSKYLGQLQQQQGQQQQQEQEQQKQQDQEQPFDCSQPLADIDDLTGSQPAAGPAPAPAAGRGRRAGSRASRAAQPPAAAHEEARAALRHQQALAAALAQAQHAGDEDDSDEVVSDGGADDGGGGAAARRPYGTARVDLTGDGDSDDPLALLQELTGGSQDAAQAAGPGAGAAGAAGGGGAGGGKLELKFKSASHSVTLRVAPGAPLGQAMRRYQQYASEQGWGRVARFVYDDERLEEGDTPAGLDMEEGDCVDVYLEGA